MSQSLSRSTGRSLAALLILFGVFSIATAEPSLAGAKRTRGQTEASNSGAKGNCTWGAKEKFKRFTGVYPRLTGNAKDYAAAGRRTGWKVVSTPEKNAIIVFQPGVQGANRQYGHVGWVVDVNGKNVTFIEMNGAAGYNRYGNRTVKHVSGMEYVLAI